MTVRATASDRRDDALAAVMAAFDDSDIHHGEPAVLDGERVRLPIIVDDRPFTATIRVTAYCTGERARALVGREHPGAADVLFLVADRMTTDARDVLSDAGWSWLDRRGRLHLRAPGVRVDVDVAPAPASAAAPSRAPIAGRGGIAVAYWLCAHRSERISPTRDAPTLGLAPSTVSVSVQRLAEAGLVDAGAGLFPELFWELAAVWRTKRTWLATPPDPTDHVQPDPAAARWSRSGTAAAAAYGAPVVTTAGGPLELYVPGPVEITIAVRRYGAADDGTGAAVLAIAPAMPVVKTEPGATTLQIDGWPAAPVLAVALDLAQDRARGREILTEWRTDGDVWR
jgi:hypothetical protein